jgi:hypothetical protein
MTRLEQARKRAAVAARKLDEARERELAEEATEILKKQKATDKRRYQTGAIADEEGLLVWDASTLRQIFQLLTPLTALPNPVGTLDALIGIPLVLAEHGVNVSPDATEEE